MHYAVPRMLERAGLLERLYTDICASKDWPRLLRLVPPALRDARMERLLGRDLKGIPGAARDRVHPASASSTSGAWRGRKIRTNATRRSSGRAANSAGWWWRAASERRGAFTFLIPPGWRSCRPRGSRAARAWWSRPSRRARWSGACCARSRRASPNGRRRRRRTR
ncbi:MAG: hypothetical protein WDO13_19365 [Verrucomicrobiota bacterium]